MVRLPRGSASKGVRPLLLSNARNGPRHQGLARGGGSEVQGLPEARGGDQPLRAGDGSPLRRGDPRGGRRRCASAPATATSLDDLLPEAFALTREASRRTTGQRHYDVQLIGGMVLHDGAIAEMRTGEGKTLTATLPVFLNTLAGGSVHVVTVNDYLARRDSEWMAPIYEALGVSVAALQDADDHAARQRKYACDVTYGTNSEFGFDYLRDNMSPVARELRPARPRLRDRGRGRQHPDRRGADAADHLRPARTGGPDLLHLRPPGQTDWSGCRPNRN